MSKAKEGKRERIRPTAAGSAKNPFHEMQSAPLQAQIMALLLILSQRDVPDRKLLDLAPFKGDQLAGLNIVFGGGNCLGEQML